MNRKWFWTGIKVSVASQEKVAQLAEGCWCSNPTHTHTLQVRILLCAAKALCGLLQRWFFGRGGIFKRCLLLVGWVRFRVWHSLSGLAACWKWVSWFCGSGWIIRGKRVRIWNLLDGFWFLHASLLAFLLFLALLQQGGLRRLHQDGWILLQVLAPRRLSQHNDSSSVHAGGGLEVQLPSVLFPALQLGMMLPFQFSRRHWNLQDLWWEGTQSTVESERKTLHSFSVQQFWRMWPLNPVECEEFEKRQLFR